MKNARNSFFIVLGLIVAEVIGGVRADAAEVFEYPELSVVPRASERLDTEGKQERDRRVTSLLPIQISGLMTMMAGVAQFSGVDEAKDVEKRSPYAGIAVGGSWLAVTFLLNSFSTAYEDGAHELSTMPRKTTRDQLTRERFSEEVIRHRGRLGLTLRLLSVLSNFATSVYMINNSLPLTTAKSLDGMAIITSLAPLIFRTHWEDVSDEQADYKKRIYAPVASAALFRQGIDGHYAPGLQLQFQF